MEEINYEEMCKGLLRDIEDLGRLIAKKQKEVERLKEEHSERKIERVSQPSIEKVIVQEEEDIFFEETVYFYLINYRLLREGFTDNEIRFLLPRRNHPDYVNILLRLSLESTKEIIGIKELLQEEMSDSDREICEQLIIHEQRKIDYIRGRLLTNNSDAEKEPEEEKNNIVLVPTIAGNIRIIDELEHIPLDYYEGFNELINSIIDGTFKNVKMLKFDNIVGSVFEVKLFKIRVVFTRLNANTFALITAFVKKSDTDKLYRESLASKIRDYYLIEDRIKAGLLNDKFLEENEANVRRLWETISVDESKILKRGDK